MSCIKVAMSQQALRGWQRVLRASADRHTRFHTARNELMPIGAWAAMPRSIFQRLGGQQANGPWIVPAAVRWLDAQIQPTWQVLELGAGASTPWLAERAKTVLSFEDDPGWHREVSRRLAESKVDNCDLRLTPLDQLPKCLSDLPRRDFDLAFIDCNEREGFDRLACVRLVRDLVKPGALLLLDDSDKPAYRSQDAVLSGWTLKRFVGIKQFPLMAVETSIYQRPS
jgi:Methyltransferase domain